MTVVSDAATQVHRPTHDYKRKSLSGDTPERLFESLSETQSEIRFPVDSWYFSPSQAPIRVKRNPSANPAMRYGMAISSFSPNSRNSHSRITATIPANAGSLIVTPGDLYPTMNPAITKLTRNATRATSRSILKIFEGRNTKSTFNVYFASL
jgi:hypothetical protein